MPITEHTKRRLYLLDSGAIREAHNILRAEGYEFAGYHGCNHQTLLSIVPYNFDTQKSGSGAGSARGDGLYVSRKESLALDWSEGSILDGDPEPPEYKNKIKPYPASKPRVLRIYAKHFSRMNLGVDYEWGVQSRAGDPNGDLNVGPSGRDFMNLHHDLELIFKFRVYNRLAAIPSLGSQRDNQHLGPEMTIWKAHTV